MDVINIQIIENRQTGLLLAFSKDLPGLMVQGRDISQIEERAPLLVKQLIEEREGIVVSVSMDRIEPDLPAFEYPIYKTSINRDAA